MFLEVEKVRPDYDACAHIASVALSRMRSAHRVISCQDGAEQRSGAVEDM